MKRIAFVSLGSKERKSLLIRYGPIVWLEEGPGPTLRRFFSDFIDKDILIQNKVEQRKKAAEAAFHLLVTTTGVFGFELPFQTLLKEEVMFTVIGNSAGFVDLTFETFPGPV